MAFVVVLHLNPNEESRLADILQSDLPLPVTQVTELVRIAPGHVYVIPPSQNLLVDDGALILEPIEDERHLRRPVDHLFRTLAEAHGEHAVGVVLSGTGANGTVGARRIRERGGLVLAQDPDEAAFDEMPRSAIAAGIVDHVGPAGRLGAEVAAYAGRLRGGRLPDSPAAMAPDGVRTLQHVLALLHARTGHDFAHYKRSTVLRRLDRRLHITGARSLEGYLEFLRTDAAEARALLADLLISVTNFFRDPEAFAILDEAVPRLFEGKGPQDQVRVWVAGCATGEEAYSVAMLLLEHAATLPEPPRVQVFASDLSGDAIRVAREGAYPESIEADVSAERLRRFFTHASGHYRVRESLREAVLFTPHSLLKDPPFSRLDLVTCRNLLIYLQRDLQQQVLALLHYALRPSGLLFLGASESIDRGSGLFRALDKGARLFQRLDVETPLPRLPRVPPALTVAPADPANAARVPPSAPPPAREVERLHRSLREEIAPPSVLVSEDGEVIHVSDAASPYLRVTGGPPSRNLARLLHPALRLASQTTLLQARQTQRPSVSRPVDLEVEGEVRRVTVRARPAPGGLIQVVFDALPAPPSAPPDDSEDAHVRALEEELQHVREQLRVSIEEFETSREELQAQNEELQSMNEELRSTAEELETAKEEAQSVSEELRTVNDELNAKVEELARSRSDLENLIASTEIATLFLDRGLRIQQFTPPAREHFHVRSSDVGRPLADLAQQFGGARLVEDAEAVLDRLEAREREVEREDGRHFLVHVRPYRSVENRIDGVVITFVDITRRKEDEEALRWSEARLNALTAANSDALYRMSPDWSELLHLEGEGFLADTTEPNRDWQAAYLHPDDRPRIMARIEEAVRTETPFEMEHRVRCSDGSYGWTFSRAVPLLDAAGRITEWFGAANDITAHKTAQEALRVSEERYRLLVEGTTEYAVLMLDPALRVTSWNTGAERIFGYAEAEVLGEEGALLFTEEDRAAGVPEAEAEQAAETGRARDDRWHVRRDGSRFWASGIMTALREPDGALRGFAKILRDNTERKRAEDALRESEERLRIALAAAEMGVWSVDVRTGAAERSARFYEIYGYTPDPAGATVDDFYERVHPDDLPRVRAAVEAALRVERPYREEFRIVRPDGRTCWVHTEGRCLRDESGAPDRLTGVVYDVTGRKEIEQELQALTEALEERVRERTRELAASELRVRMLAHALITAEQEERHRIAQVLHDDLQQLLFALSTTLHLLRSPRSEEEAHDLHGQTNEILDEAAELTRSLSMEMSPPVLASSDLEELLQWVAARKKKRYGLEVEVDVEAPCEIPLYTSRVLLYRTLQELLFNVVKHADTRQARLRARPVEGALVVEVEDEGVGFEVQRLEGRNRPDGGFGLYHVRERLALAGGAFEIASAPGQGTRVTITVPIAPAEVPMWSATSVAPYPDDPAAAVELAGRHLVEPVRFRALADALHADGVRAFVQVGTGSLMGFVDDTLRDHDVISVSANTAKQTGVGQLRRVAAALWSGGRAVDFSPLGHVVEDDPEPEDAPAPVDRSGGATHHTAGSPSGVAARSALPLRLGSALVRDLTPLDLTPLGFPMADARGATVGSVPEELRGSPGSLLGEFQAAMDEASTAARQVLGAATAGRRPLHAAPRSSSPSARRVSSGPVEPAAPTSLSQYCPAPMSGLSPTRPGIFQDSPLVVVTDERSPAASTAFMLMVPVVKATSASSRGSSQLSVGLRRVFQRSHSCRELSVSSSCSSNPSERAKRPAPSPTIRIWSV